ncbi:SpoIID/LytB domain-containing protein [Aeromicrobium sp.]|uniref:SpoIID/LytB domain-containing protein n=1 Tax=Aeromicrobium sp. TaxID=1871063 RepID=UPI0030BD4AB9
MLSWHTGRRTSGFSIAALLAVGMLVPTPAAADGAQVSGGAPGTVAAPQAPAEVRQQQIPTQATPKPHAPRHDEAPAADHVVAELTRTDLRPFAMLGVTWTGGLRDDQTVVEVRWREAGASGARTWSPWTELHTEPASEEGVPGTEPQWTGKADAAAVRVISSANARPEGLALSTIDPRGRSVSTTASTASTMSTVSTAAVSRPAIISRATWGASTSGSCDSPIYGRTTRGAVIHHTAGNNTYTKSQSASIVKATQAYHKRSRGWCDIGYNFLVDKYGQIFEGRAGGTTKPVRAAHSGNGTVNEETMGVSLMGTFASTTPSAAMKTAVVNLVAWRFDNYGIAGKGTYSIGGITLNRIAGHRNVVSTECPGAKAYAWLSQSGGLRDRVVTKLAAAPAPAPAPSADFGYNNLTVPSSRRIPLAGHGYGHGIGMSQYGAQGAAKRGVTYDRILAHYYRGTQLGTKTGNIRVLISQDTTDSVIVAGRSGLVFRDIAAKKIVKLPTTVSGRTVTRWRIIQVATRKTQSTLQYMTTGGFRSFRDTRWTGAGQFEGPSAISLILPDNSAVRYRGALRSALPSVGSTSRNTINAVPIEHYVRGVIAAEMPASWMPEALKAQAVAARTYGVRAITSSRYYDICNTTACQVYGGVSRETATTDTAVRSTAGKILTYAGKPALTQFSSSSGGFSATGSQPYLKAVSDSYDNWSGNPHHSWTKTVAASTIERAYPSIGTLKRLKVTKRNGYGAWGGRVSTITLVGSKKTVTITGNAARWAFGLKSNWFRF